MTNRLAVSGFSALSHPVRLELFQALCARAPEHVSAGELAEGFDIPPSTMTGHLQALERAGLIRSERRSRFMMYSLDTEGAQRFMRYLVDDCFGRRPEICEAALPADGDTTMQEAS